jgi:hypothetical protein
MNRRWLGWLLPAALVLSPVMAFADEAKVDVWTDKGDEGVYQPGEHMDLRVRTAEDAWLLVYEIDTEGHVQLLYPYRGSSGYVEGRTTYRLPPDEMGVNLVVQQSVGQSYIVAIASTERFNELPWYLRPYDAQGQSVGYEPARDDEDGITPDGRIVGDPFVAMEKIRRRVLQYPEDGETFATSYTTYYVHDRVRYPRYICYDCHRPGRWAWWTGFDPYYTTCSVFDFQVNGMWAWGPNYWYGSVPYFYYVPRVDGPPRYAAYRRNHARYSAWNGWSYWHRAWSAALVRYKSAPPRNYVPPSRWPQHGGGATLPPGFLAANLPGKTRQVVGHDRPGDAHDPGRGDGRRGGGGDDGHRNAGDETISRHPVDRSPAGQAPGEGEGKGRSGEPSGGVNRGSNMVHMPRVEAPPRGPQGNGRQDHPPYEPPPRRELPGRGAGDRAPRYEPSRGDPAPRVDAPARHDDASARPHGKAPSREEKKSDRRDEKRGDKHGDKRDDRPSKDDSSHDDDRGRGRSKG